MKYVGVPHRKQFAIGPKGAIEGFPWPNRFMMADLNGGLALTYCPDLSVATSINAYGEQVVLIGSVVEAKSALNSPPARLHEVTQANLGDLTASWTGHWLLILGNEMHTDCCGLFTVYMPRERLLQAKGEFAISNSPSLLAKFYNLGTPETDTLVLQPFAFPPWSFRPEFRTLLAGEVLNLLTGARRLSEVPPLQVLAVDVAEVRSRVADLLITAVKRLQEMTDTPVSCALSGGYDTRLNLAAASRTGYPFRAFTFVKSYFYITEADRLLPPRIASSVSVEHKMIKAISPDRKRAAAYLEHAGGAVTTFPGSGFDHYVHRYWEQAGEGGYVLDGQCYELAVNYHRKKFAPNFTASDLRVFGFGVTDDDFSEAERHWAHLREVSFDFDRRDLLFWTGNINGVYARMTQEHDLFVDLFYPACNREQMNLLLSVPVEEREGCLFQGTITASIRAELGSIPYNPPEPLHKRIIKRLRNEALSRISTVRLKSIR
jgi:hypothetical protein